MNRRRRRETLHPSSPAGVRCCHPVSRGATLLACWLTVLCLLGQPPALAGTITTVAGTGQSANNGSQGPALKINVGAPFGVEIGPDKNLYITEVENHRVLKLELRSGTLSTVAGTGKGGYSGDGSLATQADLNEPYEVRFDQAGNMYFVEMKNHIIRCVEKKTGIIRTIAGTGTAGFSGDGGPATKAQMKNPHSIALDQQEGLYVADIGNHRIRRIDLKTGMIRTIAGNQQKKLPRDGQRAQGNPIRGPRALCYRNQTLWIALREGHSVWRLDLPTGKLHHIAGNGKQGFSGDGGPPQKAQFNGPKGIALGPQGNIFVVDTENQTIRKIDLKKRQITTVAGSGPSARGGAGDKGPATQAELDRPHGICVDAQGQIFIGDTLNHRVRRIQP